MRKIAYLFGCFLLACGSQDPNQNIDDSDGGETTATGGSPAPTGGTLGTHSGGQGNNNMTASGGALATGGTAGSLTGGTTSMGGAIIGCAMMLGCGDAGAPDTLASNDAGANTDTIANVTPDADLSPKDADDMPRKTDTQPTPAADASPVATADAQPVVVDAEPKPEPKPLPPVSEVLQRLAHVPANVIWMDSEGLMRVSGRVGTLGKKCSYYTLSPLFYAVLNQPPGTVGEYVFLHSSPFPYTPGGRGYPVHPAAILTNKELDRLNVSRKPISSRWTSGGRPHPTEKPDVFPMSLDEWMEKHRDNLDAAIAAVQPVENDCI